jgi:hypothetical protein
MRFGDKSATAIHDMAQELTDALEVIGFDREGSPYDHDKFAPFFFTRFIELAREALEQKP